MNPFLSFGFVFLYLVQDKILDRILSIFEIASKCNGNEKSQESFENPWDIFWLILVVYFALSNDRPIDCWNWSPIDRHDDGVPMLVTLCISFPLSRCFVISSATLSSFVPSGSRADTSPMTTYEVVVIFLVNRAMQ